VICPGELKHEGTKTTETHEGLGEMVTDDAEDHAGSSGKEAIRRHQALRASSCPPWLRASIRSEEITGGNPFRVGVARQGVEVGLTHPADA